MVHSYRFKQSQIAQNDVSGVRDKVFNEIKLQDLNKDTGVELLIKYLDFLFKSEVYERYTKFDRYERKIKIKWRISFQSLKYFITELSKNQWNYLKSCSLLSY